MDNLSIAMISPYDFSFPSGVNSHAIDLSRYLISRGHKVDLIGPSSSACSIEGLNFRSLGNSISLPVSNTSTKISLNPVAYLKLKSILKSKFDIVHIHEPFMPLISLSALLISKHPIIATFHAYHEYKNKYKGIHDLMSPLANRIQQVICVSEAAKAYIKPNLENFKGKISIIPNGIQVAKFTNNAKLNSNSQAFTVTFIGRNEPRKGLKFLLSALEDLSYLHYTFKLLIVGMDDLTQYKSMFPNLFKTLQVECLGSVDKDLIPQILHQSDVLCVPSTEGESFGIILLEALASQTPLIATNITGYAALLSADEYPCIEAKDPKAIRNALEKLFLYPDLRYSLTNLGDTIAKKYDWQIIGSVIESTYLDVCKTNDIQT